MRKDRYSLQMKVTQKKMICKNKIKMIKIAKSQILTKQRKEHKVKGTGPKKI